MHWPQINLCIQLLFKHISTFHTNHKQNLNDICLNFNRYESKLLEKINAKITLERKILENDIIDKNVNDIWFLKEKKDNIDKNINENYYGEKDSWNFLTNRNILIKKSRIFLCTVIIINVFVKIILFLLQESNILDVFVNDIVFFANIIFKNLSYF